jgi:hypothetical protein
MDEQFRKAQRKYDNMEPPEPTAQQVRDSHREDLELVLNTLEELLGYMRDDLGVCKEVKLVDKAYLSIDLATSLLKPESM